MEIVARKSARDTRTVSREWRERGTLRVIMKEQALGIDDGLDSELGEPRLEAEMSSTMGPPVEMQSMRMERWCVRFGQVQVG